MICIADGDMAEVPKNDSNDFVKTLFWVMVLVCFFLVVVMGLLVWYYRPTFEIAR
jgi:heme/copper-type cytochrome/quinol oxidase subunit 2